MWIYWGARRGLDKQQVPAREGSDSNFGPGAWIKIDVSGDRSGLILRESWFAGGRLTRDPGDSGVRATALDARPTIRFG